MALSDTDAWMTVNDQSFRNRVQAAAYDRAYGIYPDPPNSNAIIQAKRLLLASRIVQGRDYTDPFAWSIVSRTLLTSPNAIDDTEITNLTQNTAFDQLADQLIATSEITTTQESQGVAAFGAAATTATAISHGLGTTPTADKFWFAFAADPLAAGQPWASAITSSTFTLNLKAAPGGAGTSVAWRVKL